MDNAITQIQFPPDLETGLEVVMGTRIEQYLSAHPQATEAEAYQVVRQRLQSASIPLGIDAVIAGEGQFLRAIVALPTDQQMAIGNEALEIEFIDSPIFNRTLLERWLADCEIELKQQVYDFCQSQRD